MSQPIPGPIPAASATVQGQVSTVQQSFGGLKLFPGDVADAHDLRTYGAVIPSGMSVDHFPTSDSSAAIKAAIAAQPVQGGVTNQPFGALNFPVGLCAISEPIWFPDTAGGLRVRGAGQRASLIYAGVGSPESRPDLVEGFAGPMVIMGGAVGGQPSYGPDLFGGSGRSLALSYTGGTCVKLSDAWCWSNYLRGHGQMSLEFRLKLGVAGSVNAAIIGSRGNLTFSDGAQVSYGLYLLDNGGGPQLAAIITTSGGPVSVISATGLLAYSNPTPYDISYNYDGAHLDVYINGVNCIHQAVTGTLVQKFFEGITIGKAGNDGNEAWDTITGDIQSIRLSNVARHTGTGSYTPSGVPFTTFDINTLAIYNFDQGDTPATAPFLKIGRVVNGAINAGTVVHYARLLPAATPYCDFSGLGLIGQNQNTGHVSGAFQCSFRDYSVWSAGYFGMYNLNPDGFYDKMDNCTFYANNMPAKLYVYESTNITVGGGIASCWLEGAIDSLNCQPNSNTIYDLIVGGVGLGPFSSAYLRGASMDTESVPFTAYKANMLIIEGNVLTKQCSFQGPITGGSAACPNVLLDGLGVFNSGGGWSSEADQYETLPTATGRVEATSGAVGSRFAAAATVKIRSPQILNANLVPLVPWTSTGVAIDMEDASYVDKTATPGDCTINAIAGRFAMAAGLSSVTVDNNLVQQNSSRQPVVVVVKEGLDATATDYRVQVFPGAGFTVVANANATGNLNFAFSLKVQ